MFIRMKLQGSFGKKVMTLTPLFGLVLPSSVNLYFSRSKELRDGIPVNDPATSESIRDIPSQVATKNAFLESWMIRLLIPLPLFFGPMGAAKWATKNTKFYHKTIPKFAFDAAVVTATLAGGLIFVMSGFSSTGYIKLNKLKPKLQERLKEYSPETIIKFTKEL